MAIRYKIKVLPALLEKGITTYKLRNDAILSEGTIQKLRAGDSSITIKSLDALCSLLGCQPGDILEHVQGEDREPENL